jgi:hypothetical protein
MSTTTVTPRSRDTEPKNSQKCKSTQQQDLGIRDDL